MYVGQPADPAAFDAYYWKTHLPTVEKWPGIRRITIAKGGPGLPKESTPWYSVMPAWEDRLTEDQTWQVIMYLYAATGQQPRRWESAH